jgi:hypothetical protein
MPYRDPQKHRDYYREYMRKRAALKKAGLQPEPKAKPASQLDPEAAKLKERIRALEDELAGLKSEPKAKAAASPPPDPEAAKLKERIRVLEAELAVWQRSGRPPPLPKTAEEWDAWREAGNAAKAKRAAERAAAKAKAASMTPEEERTVLEKLEQAEKSLKARNTQIKNLKADLSWLRDKTPPKMSKRLYRAICKVLHPDSTTDVETREKLNKIFQEFSVIKFKFPPDEATR